MPEPASRVSFRMAASAPLLEKWLAQAFQIPPDLAAAAGGGTGAMRVRLVCLRTGQPLTIEGAAFSGGMEVAVLTDDMDVAGDVVQVPIHPCE